VGEGIASPPATWDELFAQVNKLTKKDDRGNVLRAGGALGEYRNVKNAKEILSLLMLQTGNKIVDPRTLDVVFQGGAQNVGQSPAVSALSFFLEFSNPSKTFTYSWNRSLPLSDEMFVSGKLAFYFGRISEFNELQDRNPHLNFDIAVVPQVRDASIKATYGGIFGLVISKLSPNQSAVMSAALRMGEADMAKAFSDRLGIIPARRDLLSAGSPNSVLSVGYRSAIMSRGWLQPDEVSTGQIFQRMVESVGTGKALLSEAVNVAERELGSALNVYK
jgi:ABC-type glycerol-3-phosphate transport system substrate-binding protein